MDDRDGLDATASAALLYRQGRYAQAAEAFERLICAAGPSPELVAHLARALLMLGRIDEAHLHLEQSVYRWPTDIQLHQLLARLRWTRGDGEQSMIFLERAIERHPLQLQLRLVAADLFRHAGDLDKALELLNGGLARVPDSAGFLTSVGVLLGDMGRHREALGYLRTAIARAPHVPQMRRNLIPASLCADDPAQAADLCADLLRTAPNDQQLIAYWATAQRMLGHDDYRRLHDYPRLVQVFRPAPPSGFADIRQFNAALADSLAAWHRSSERPLDQSIRGGTQTDRNLPLEDPSVAAFFSMLDASIRQYIASLDADGAHPTDRRKSGGYRIAGSWSVQLRPGGFHVNHVHPAGWVSSAYYIEIPDIPGSSSKAGWLKFGEPGFPAPGCGADHFVRPEPGMLVLFPSFMWHGTVPFDGGKRRLTAAFDVVPA